MYDAGWLVNGPYSPIDILQSLQQHSSDHTPGYFMLLSLWGNLIAYDIALARILTIFIGLLSLAMAYRLARDFVAPAAGLFALIIVASNAFYNFYYVHVRMYTLLVLTTAIVLWLYLRITHQQKQVKKTDYAALSIAVFALISTHAFSAAFLLMLGIYHLFIAPKNQRWWRVSATVIAALLLFSPYLLILRSGIEQTFENKSIMPNIIGSWTVAVRTWLTLLLNNSVALLAPSLIGLALRRREGIIPLRSYFAMFVSHLLMLALLAEFTTSVRMPDMRYHLVGWLPFILLTVAGLHILYRFRRWLGLLILLWVTAGLAFQNNDDWGRYIGSIRARFFQLPPAQLISRLALQEEQKPTVIGYLYPAFALNRIASIDYVKLDYYFTQHNITFEDPDNIEKFEEDVRYNTLASPSLWVFYQTSKVDAAKAAEIESIIHDLNYQLCETIEIGIDTVIRQYAWQTLDCQPPQLLSSHQTAALDYQFYGAALHADESKLYFSDQWTARTDDDLSDFQMSYQLISANWSNVAQLDLPLVHEGQPRQFSIDISDVPAGQYRLMSILYDKRTGQRQNWLNSEDDPPAMLTLTGIAIPAR